LGWKEGRQLNGNSEQKIILNAVCLCIILRAIKSPEQFSVIHESLHNRKLYYKIYFKIYYNINIFIIYSEARTSVRLDSEATALIYTHFNETEVPLQEEWYTWFIIDSISVFYVNVNYVQNSWLYFNLHSNQFFVIFTN